MLTRSQTGTPSKAFAHFIIDDFECYFCSKRFFTFNRFNVHMKTVHSREYTKEQNNDFSETDNFSEADYEVLDFE